MLSAPASRASPCSAASKLSRLKTRRLCGSARDTVARRAPASNVTLSIGRPPRGAHPASADARAVTPPPHAFSRGWLPSISATRAPDRASTRAATAPAGPAPTIATSNRRIYLPSVFRLPSSVFRLPSSVFRLPSSVFPLPSSVFRLRQIPIPGPDAHVRPRDAHGDRAPLLFAAQDRTRRSVAEQVLVAQLVGDRTHRRVQLLRIGRLERAAAS